jgi:hypothetical protein
MKRRLLLLATTLCLLAPDAFAQSKVPSLINYQGNVRTAAGVPIGNGTATNRLVTFRFWKSPTSVLAADRLWSESQTATILDGNFNVLIGGGAAVSGETNAVTPFANVFSQNSSVYLGITVDDGNAGTVDAEISPRQQLVSGAFAFRATVAEGVDNLAITTGMLSSNSVTTNQLGAAAVTTAKISNDAVTSAQILNGTIGVDELGTGAVTSDKILDGTVASADIAADTITAGDIAPGAVASSEILDASIATADIADAAVTTAKIADAAITTAKIADAAITTAKIASGVNLSAGTLTATGNATIGSVNGTATLKVNDKPVPVGEENLRIIRGSVTAAGAITSGTGFTAAIDGVHYVKVTFTAGTFSSAPTVVVSPWDTSAGFPQYVTNITATSFSSTGAFSGISGASRQNFTFIAIGPR